MYPVTFAHYTLYHYFNGGLCQIFIICVWLFAKLKCNSEQWETIKSKHCKQAVLTSLWRSRASCLAAGPNPVKDLALIFNCKLLRHREKTENAKHLSCFTTENAASRLPVSKSTWRICWIGTTWPKKENIISHIITIRSSIFIWTCKTTLSPSVHFKKQYRLVIREAAQLKG